MMRFITLILLLLAAGIHDTAAQERPALLQEYLQKWKNSTEYTLELVRSFPEDKLDFRPADSTMTFREQVVHITRAIIQQSGTYLREKDFGRTISADTTYTKAELLTNLEDAYRFSTGIIETLTAADLETRVDFFAGNFTKRQMLNVLDDHITHHKGQLVVYLRLNGIKPPRFRGW